MFDIRESYEYRVKVQEYDIKKAREGGGGTTISRDDSTVAIALHAMCHQFTCFSFDPLFDNYHTIPERGILRTAVSRRAWSAQACVVTVGNRFVHHLFC